MTMPDRDPGAYLVREGRYWRLAFWMTPETPETLPPGGWLRFGDPTLREDSFFAEIGPRVESPEAKTGKPPKVAELADLIRNRDALGMTCDALAEYIDEMGAERGDDDMKRRILVFLATRGPRWLRRRLYFRAFTAAVVDPLNLVMKTIADNADATARDLMTLEQAQEGRENA